MTANYLRGADAFASWHDDILQGKRPTLFPIGDAGPLKRIEIGPGLITLVGGSPGAGKTAFTMQAVVDALRLTPNLQAVVCNVEMSPAVLLDRQLSRLAGVPLDDIRYRDISDYQADAVDVGCATLETLAERLAFVRLPFDLGNVAAVADDFAPLDDGNGTLIVLDYIQRVGAPGQQADRRGTVDATMGHLRQFADAGAALIVVSAVGRQKDKRGSSTYAADSMTLASFKESGELEFGADDAFILVHGKERDRRTLKHLKSRHGECRDIDLWFDGTTQAFESVGGPVDVVSVGDDFE